ncbi:igE-binding protein-like [Aphis craccivora]|uniref:IgE-binding protein-like n=1 Tax=Aphis craccivora TaxID=307492 RepID=A0A6G0ZFQ6_APHCR|nr:igE-binding protein-like [Aphis craccivora]
MEKFCAERGLPECIISDCGTCFTAHAFEVFCEKNGIHQTLNSTRHPRESGREQILSYISTTEEPCENQDLRRPLSPFMLNLIYQTVYGYGKRLTEF